MREIQRQTSTFAFRFAANEMATVYHVTTKKGLDAIKREGIKPQSGSRATQLGEDSPGIYVFPTRDHMEDALGNWLGEAYEDEPDHLYGLTVNCPASWLEDSPAGYEKVCRQPIPPHMISDVEDLG